MTTGKWGQRFKAPGQVDGIGKAQTSWPPLYDLVNTTADSLKQYPFAKVTM